MGSASLGKWTKPISDLLGQTGPDPLGIKTGPKTKRGISAVFVSLSSGERTLFRLLVPSKLEGEYAGL